MSAGTAQARPLGSAAPWRPGRPARAAVRALAALVVAAAVVSVFPAQTGPSETGPAGLLFADEGDKARAIAAEPDALAPDPPAGSVRAPASVSRQVTAAAGARDQDANGSSWLGNLADVFAPGDPPGGPRRLIQRRDR